MRKNIILTIILSLLITFAYLWEQRDYKSEFESSEKNKKILTFRPFQVIEIELKNAKLIKREGQWIVGELNYPASDEKISYILNQLNSLMSVSQLDVEQTDDSQFFVHQDHTFSVKTFNKELKFRLGDISSVSGYFYLETMAQGKKKLFLAKDDSSYDGLYKSDLELEFKKYLALKNIITMSPMQLISERIMKPSLLKEVSKVKIDNKRNRWFELEFKKNQTIPKVYSPLEYFSLRESFNQLINKIKVKKIILKEKNVLADLLSEMTLYSEDLKEIVTYKLFGTLNNKNGLYVTYESSSFIYLIEDKSKKLFFTHVQDFWKKKIHFSKDLSKIKNFTFSLSNKKKSYQFLVKDIEDFKVEANDKRIKSLKHHNINLIFNILFNLVDFKQANMVSDELSQLSNKNATIGIKLLDKEFKIHFDSNLIIVQDLSDNLEYVFSHRNHAIKINNLEDFFTLK